MPNNLLAAELGVMHKNDMQRVLIFGNSGSGKSTLAKTYVSEYGLVHLDLDRLAWLDTIPPKRKPLIDSANQINAFTSINKNWVIEGCYSDLLNVVKDSATEVIFLNLSIETCISNCKSRPWEPHKYKTADEQDKNLAMLLHWVKDYSIRDDEFSLSSHKALFEQFKGKKVEYNLNERNV